MRKSLILALTAIGGGVGYAAGVTEVATGPGTDDPSTWRWHVSSILSQSDTQVVSAGETVGVLGAQAFNQRYERYTPFGLPQPRGEFAVEFAGLQRDASRASMFCARAQMRSKLPSNASTIAGSVMKIASLS